MYKKNKESKPVVLVPWNSGTPLLTLSFEAYSYISLSVTVKGLFGVCPIKAGFILIF